VSFFDEFLDVVGQEITWEKRKAAYTGDRGEVAYDAPVTITARVVEKVIQIHDSKGDRYVQGAEIQCAPTPLVTAGDRVTLPSGLVTEVVPGARREVDENGDPSHQELRVGRA
jgi:hypothetical protein